MLQHTHLQMTIILLSIVLRTQLNPKTVQQLVHNWTAANTISEHTHHTHVLRRRPALNSSPPPRVVCASKPAESLREETGYHDTLDSFPRDNGQQKGFCPKVTPLKTFLDHFRLQKSQKSLWRILLRPEFDTYSPHVRNLVKRRQESFFHVSGLRRSISRSRLRRAHLCSNVSFLAD